MSNNEQLQYRQEIPTTLDSYDINYLGRVSELIKDVFTSETRQYFNTKMPERQDAIPSIEKYSGDIAGESRDLDPLATVVRVARQFADIIEKTPAIIVSAGNIRNKKMSISTRQIGTLFPRPYLISGQGSFAPPSGPGTTIPASPASWPDDNSPTIPTHSTYPIGTANLYLVDGDFVEITTIIDGITHVSNIQFNGTILGIAPQTPRLIADIINLQALYCQASVILISNIPTLIISAGGPGLMGKKYSIQRTNASANFDKYINFVTTAQIAPSNTFPALNRYMFSLEAEVSLFILTEGENIRTEILDLVLDFFTFVMEDRQFQFFGRSFYGNVDNESYQIVIKDSKISSSGEQEVARQDDPTRKTYINKVSIPIDIYQFVDRQASMGISVVQSSYIPTFR